MLAKGPTRTNAIRVQSMPVVCVLNAVLWADIHLFLPCGLA